MKFEEACAFWAKLGFALPTDNPVSDDDYVLAPDGYPKYYMKKPSEAASHQYNLPVPPTEAWKRKKLNREGKHIRWIKWAWSLIWFLILKFIDNYLVYQYVFLMPRSCRIITAGCILYNNKMANKQIITKEKLWKLPMFRFFFVSSFYPLLAACTVHMFFYFDDIIDGPMFPDACKQKIFMSLKENLKTIVDRPYLLLQYIPDC